MTKSITISYDEADEALLLALFERLGITIEDMAASDSDMEREVIRQRLNEKYVLTGLWEKLNEEERKTAVRVEKAHFQEERGNSYESQIEADAFLKDMNNQLLGL